MPCGLFSLECYDISHCVSIIFKSTGTAFKILEEQILEREQNEKLNNEELVIIFPFLLMAQNVF